MSPVLWVLVALVLLALFVAGQYNKLVRMRQLGRNAWSDVDVYLKRRADLIPNLVATVKGYAAHEKTTLEEVVAARNNAVSAPSVAERAKAEGILAQGISKLFALAEAYPDLKANANFMQLQADLGDCEKSVQDARLYYNAVARDNNTLVESFPSGMFASMFDFGPLEFFEVATAEERAVPKVEF